MQNQRIEIENPRTNGFKISTALVGGMRIGYSYTVTMFKPSPSDAPLTMLAEHILIAFSLRALMNNPRDQVSIALAALVGAYIGAGAGFITTYAMTNTQPSP